MSDTIEDFLVTLSARNVELRAEMEAKRGTRRARRLARQIAENETTMARLRTMPASTRADLERMAPTPRPRGAE